MNLNLIKFLAGILGLALWAWLAFLKMTPVEPLIDLLKMGLGGLVVHMLTGGTGAAPIQAVPGVVAVAPPGQGGFASVRLLAAIAVVALGLAMLAGCTSLARGYEATAATEIRAANDNMLEIWKAAACAMPVGAVLRSPDVIETVNKFCGGAQSQLGTVQPITVNVTVPAAAAAASSTK